ncbi:MFS transporter [Cryobacterium sp. TMT2-17-1]|uniref:MFS transporter n=1 Tax=unclassified Cryobacterium TaxID=2649013 RepID=UPI00106ABDD2|nr:MULTISPECIES: MFS transporter [unclassified Cryobacterium]TFB56537.1 MFS transporter [Cryobacterium sp. Sr3]TFC48828.1 MFS transporter [Cryobacterium sp. TMT2-17-1]TFC69895.1 MFS transporter [Cryobacterium sp. TMT2-4]
MISKEHRVLIVAILASFVAFLDGSIVTVALPAISREFGGGLVLQQWAVDGYLLSLGALILVAGSLSDTFGRVRVLRIGLVWFGITSLACAVAPWGSALVLARVLQGVAAALLVPSSLALITSTFSGAAQARAIGAWTGWTGIAGIMGPVLGGILVDTLSWRLIFGLNVIPIMVTLVLLAGLDEPVRTRPAAPIDAWGAGLAALGLGGPVFALIEQGRLGWASPVVFVPLVVGLLAFAGFLWWEARAPHPMMPLSLFKIRNFGVGNIATVGFYAALGLGFFVFTLYLQQVGGFSATVTGFAGIPATAMLLLFATLFGTLAGRYGPRAFMTVGPMVAGAGFLLLLGAVPPIALWSQVVPAVVVIGLGLAITVAPLTSAVLGSIRPEQAGIGSAINNAVARVAGLVAVALAGTIIGTTLDVPGFQRVMVVVAGLMFAGGLASWLGIRTSGPVLAPEHPE